MRRYGDAPLTTVGKLWIGDSTYCMERVVYWRFDQQEEVQKRTIEGQRAVSG